MDNLALVQIFRIEESCPIERHHQLGLGGVHLGDAFRLFTLPAGPGDHEVSTAITRRAATDTGEVVRVEIDQLNAVIAPLLDRRDGKPHGFWAQIERSHRIGGIRIRRPNRLVVGSAHSRNVGECRLPDGRCVGEKLCASGCGEGTHLR